MPSDKEIGTVDASQAFVGGPNETAVAETFTNALVEGKPLADDGALYSTVQDAENAASSWVFVPPGTFNESVTIDTAGLTLEGVGYESYIDGGTIGDAITIDASNVTIRSISVGTTYGAGNANSVIVTGTNADSGLITGVVVRESDYYGIWPSDGTDWTISNCRVDNTESASIRVGGARSIVFGCVVTNADAVAGVYVGGDDSIVSSCVFDSAGGKTINLQGSDSIAIGCRIHNASEHGIEVNSADSIVANNRVSDSTDTDINDSGTGTATDANLTGSAN